MTNSSGKLNGEPKWLTPPFGSAPRAPDAEDARARCQDGVPVGCLVGVLGTPQLVHDVLERFRDAQLLAEQPAPVAVHSPEQRLVVEQLRWSTRSCGSSRSRRRPPAVQPRRARRASRPGSGSPDPGWRGREARSRRRASAPAWRRKSIHELVVLAREHVVIEAHPDGPVVRERGGLLARPVRVHRVAGSSAARYPCASPAACVRRAGPPWQARRVLRVALDSRAASARRSRRSGTRPTRPCSCSGRSSARGADTRAPPCLNVGGAVGVGHKRLVDRVLRPAAEPRDLLGVSGVSTPFDELGCAARSS